MADEIGVFEDESCSAVDALVQTSAWLAAAGSGVE
jgi:hypothetical protein